MAISIDVPLPVWASTVIFSHGIALILIHIRKITTHPFTFLKLLHLFFFPGFFIVNLLSLHSTWSCYVNFQQETELLQATPPFGVEENHACNKLTKETCNSLGMCLWYHIWYIITIVQSSSPHFLTFQLTDNCHRYPPGISSIPCKYLPFYISSS